VTIGICIPWRTDHGWREKLFDWVLPRWQETGFEVCVGVPDPDGPINVSQALNRARAQCSADVMVIASADHIPDPVAVTMAYLRAREHGWAPLFSATAGITKAATATLLRGEGLRVEDYITGEAPFCTALLAIRADVWDDIDGWDERFNGWGCEDTAFRLVLDTLYPDPPEAPPRRTIALWHEAASRDRFDANVALLAEYIGCGTNQDAMRALIARRYAA